MKVNKLFYYTISAFLAIMVSSEAHAAKNNRSFIPVYAYDAEKCVVNNVEYKKLDDNGMFNYTNITKQEYLRLMKNDTLLVTCEFKNGQSYSRTVGKIFNEQSWRTTRTTNTISTALVTGGLGLIAGPIGAQMNKDQFKSFPIIIHIPTPNANKDTINEEKTKAAKHWDETINTRCKENQKCIETAKSPFFYELRNEDLKVFDEMIAK